MPVPETIDVDPAELRLPHSRWSGADPAKLSRELSKFGTSVQGVPLPWVVRCRDGLLLITDGVTRATRFARFHPGVRMAVVVINELPKFRIDHYPRVGDRLP